MNPASQIRLLFPFLFSQGWWERNTTYKPGGITSPATVFISWGFYTIFDPIYFSLLLRIQPLSLPTQLFVSPPPLKAISTVGPSHILLDLWPFLQNIDKSLGATSLKILTILPPSNCQLPLYLQLWVGVNTHFPSSSWKILSGLSLYTSVCIVTTVVTWYVRLPLYA